MGIANENMVLEWRMRRYGRLGLRRCERAVGNVWRHQRERATVCLLDGGTGRATEFGVVERARERCAWHFVGFWFSLDGETSGFVLLAVRLFC